MICRVLESPVARLHRNLLEDATGCGCRAAIHPEDLEQLGKKVELGPCFGEAGELVARLPTFRRALSMSSISYEPLPGPVSGGGGEGRQDRQLYGTNTDIDNLKRAEQKLRQERRGIPSHHRCHTSKHRPAVP